MSQHSRRNFIKKATALLAIAAVDKKVLIAQDPNMQILTSRKNNPNLKTILPGWEGTPVDQQGKFMNHEFPFIAKFSTVLKWMTQKNPQKAFKKNDAWKMQVIKNDAFLSSSEDMILALGHASFFIRLAGKHILIDPIFGNITGNKRHTDLPLDPNKFNNLDYILVSHAHYDHCDKESIKLLQKLNPKAKFLTGLGMPTIIKKWAPNHAIEEAGWFQEYNTENIQISFVPSRHWSNRTLGDINETLWGGFVLKSNDKTIYFGGDSGYGNHFKMIGDLFPNIDVAMIGAGAYAPRWFMAPNHQDPENAVKAFYDCKAKTFIPFHYGTFDLADEPLSEPEKILTQLQTEGKINEALKLLKLGEMFKI